MSYNSKYTGAEVEAFLDKINEISEVDFSDITFKQELEERLNEKQDTINDLSTIREGAFKGATALQSIPSEYITENELNQKGYLTEHQDISGKQDKLVSGTNIKTINNTSILGSGNISITGGSGTITGVSANGTSIATSGVANIPAATTSKYGVTQLSSSTSSTSTTLAATPSAVKSAYDLANGKQDKLVSGTNIKTINGTSILGSGNITISGGGSSGGSGAYAEVNHGTSDTTFTLTPNTFHVWDEVSALTLTLGDETAGVANEFVFQFTSGSEPTALTLSDDIKWVNDSAPTINQNMIYQVSILKGLAVYLEFNNAPSIIVNTGTYNTGDMRSGATLIFEYPVASDLTVSFRYASKGSYTLYAGQTTLVVDWDEPAPPQIISLSPEQDSVYQYIII